MVHPPSGTAADTILDMMDALMEGRTPDMKDIILVRNAITQVWAREALVCRSQPTGGRVTHA